MAKDDDNDVGGPSREQSESVDGKRRVGGVNGGGGGGGGRSRLDLPRPRQPPPAGPAAAGGGGGPPPFPSAFRGQTAHHRRVSSGAASAASSSDVDLYSPLHTLNPALAPPTPGTPVVPEFVTGTAASGNHGFIIGHFGGGSDGGVLLSNSAASAGAGAGAGAESAPCTPSTPGTEFADDGGGENDDGSDAEFANFNNVATPASLLQPTTPGMAPTPLPTEIEEELNGLGLLDAADEEALVDVDVTRGGDENGGGSSDLRGGAARSGPIPMEASLHDHGGTTTSSSSSGDTDAASNRHGLGLDLASVPVAISRYAGLYRTPILLFTLLAIWPAGLYSRPKFTESIDSTFDPPKGTESGRAVEVFRRAYGGAAASGNNSSEDGGGYDGSGGLGPDDPLNPPLIVVLDGSDTDADADTLIDGRSEAYRAARSFCLGLGPYVRSRPPFSPSASPSPYPYPSPSPPSPDHDGTAPTSTPIPALLRQQNLTANHTLTVTSFYSLYDAGLGSTLAPAMASIDGRTVLLEIKFSIPAEVAALGHLKRAFVDEIMDSVEEYVSTFGERGAGIIHNGTNGGGGGAKNNNHHFAVGSTGLRYFQRDLLRTVESSLRIMDIAVLPLALLVLCAVLGGSGGRRGRDTCGGGTCWEGLRKNLHIVAVPVLTMGTSVMTWSSVMLLLCRYGGLRVTQFTPSVMMSLTVGLGVDYTLFLMSRAIGEFEEEEEKRRAEGRGLGMDDDDAGAASSICSGNGGGAGSSNANARDSSSYNAVVVRSLQTAGRTVFVSGLTLACTFMGLTLLPLQMIRGVGIGAAIAVCTSVLVNLILVPALLHTGFGGRLLLLAANSKEVDDKTATLGRGALRWGERWRQNWRRRGSDGSSPGRGSAGRLDVEAMADENGDAAGGMPTGFEAWGCLTSRDLGTTNSERPFEEEATEEEEEEDVGYTSFRDLSQPLLSDKEDGRNDADDGNTALSSVDGSEIFCSSNHQPHQKHSKSNMASSPWYRLSLYLLHPTHSIIVLLAILGVTVPVALQASKIQTSISFDLMLPTASPSMQTYRDLGTKFGLGSLSPYRIIFDGRHAGKRIDTEEAFEVMHAVVGAFVSYDMNRSSSTEDHLGARTRVGGGKGDDDANSTGAQHGLLSSLETYHFDPFSPDTKQGPQGRNATTYTGIATAHGVNVPHAVFEAAKLCCADLKYCPVESFRAISALDERATSQDRMTTYVMAILAANPFDDEGIKWLQAARERLRTLADNGSLRNFTVVLEGSPGVEHDVVEIVYDSAPAMVLLTLMVVFVLMGMFFRSIVAPLRSVISICLTQGFVFGTLVLTYQRGLFNWTRIASLQGTGEISWLAPIMAFSIIVGLSLDYDIFLIDRVVEFRMEGYTHKSSVAAGLHETGWIISAAGIIMAIAFGGLMLSASPALFQWSFLLTAAVLFDTCVIRFVRVILLGYTGQFSWWPRTFDLEVPCSESDYTSLKQSTDALLVMRPSFKVGTVVR